MKQVIVEDEYMVAKRLKRFVEQAFNHQSIQLQLFDTLDDASDYLACNSIDLLFLDLNLRGQDGFNLLKQQLAQSFHTIVVSANTDRAIEAFEIGILDFVAKPFTQQRIEKAISRLKHKEQQGQCQYLAYKQLGKLELMAVNDVLYIQAAGHYSEIHSKTGKVILHDKNLDKLLMLLPTDFLRVHRSYVVPLSSIQSVSTQPGSKYWLTLVNNQVLPIGRTRYPQLKQRLIN
ncbi:LytR/AlgR family response regulator transcription factor [Neptunicella sp. SCSIO 80796]|uniref:LytR/AlgR family response regulator transcription factor n=1 Tax=Neptunicella plasticusilytica TaxID=3117012 RepID=UPI003A4D790A